MEWGLFRHLWKHSYSKGQRVVFAQGLHWNLLVLSQYVYILLYLRWKIASDECNYMRKVSEKQIIGLKGDFSINLAFQSEACSSYCNLDSRIGRRQCWPKKKLRRGGVISDLKNFIANLVPAQPVCGKNRNEIFRKRGGGGQRPFGNFPEIH